MRPQQASFAGKPVLTVPVDDGWRAVVGIPLGQTPGPAALRLRFADGRTRNIGFTVAAREYPVQRLTITDQDKVTPVGRQPQAHRARAGGDSGRVSPSLHASPDAALCHAGAGAAEQQLRPAPRHQRPAAQSAFGHRHRRPGRRAGHGPGARPGAARGRLFLHRQHGVRRPRPGPGHAVLPLEFGGGARGAAAGHRRRHRQGRQHRPGHRAAPALGAEPERRARRSAAVSGSPKPKPRVDRHKARGPTHEQHRARHRRHHRQAAADRRRQSRHWSCHRHAGGAAGRGGASDRAQRAGGGRDRGGAGGHSTARR